MDLKAPISPSLDFVEIIAQTCEALGATTKKLEKRALIANALRSLTLQDASLTALYLSGTPFAETERRNLNAGGSLLSKALAEVSHASPAAMHAAYRRHGDFGSAAADLLEDRKPSGAPLTLERAVVCPEIARRSLTFFVERRRTLFTVALAPR